MEINFPQTLLACVREKFAISEPCTCLENFPAFFEAIFSKWNLSCDIDILPVEDGCLVRVRENDLLDFYYLLSKLKEEGLL